jgi:alpha-mannosidase
MLISNLIRKIDEIPLHDNVVGMNHSEPGTDPRWNVRFALAPHAGAFDPVRDLRTGAGFCAPLVARTLPSAGKDSPFASLANKPLFSLSAPNVVVTEIKQAEFGEGWIIRMQEIAAKATKTDFLSCFAFQSAREASPVEADARGSALKARAEGESTMISLQFKANETKHLRLLGLRLPKDVSKP